MKTCFIAAAVFFAVSAFAQTPFVPAAVADPAELTTPRVGLGQASPKEPVMLGRLRLNDPLVQRKYLNDPDLLRYLRGAYSEACARGAMAEALKTIRSEQAKEQFTAQQRADSAKLLESGRIWKLTSFEMEATFGKNYLHVANFCDCLVRELPAQELVNPKTASEVLKNIPDATQKSCEAISIDKTSRQSLVLQKPRPPATGGAQ